MLAVVCWVQITIVVTDSVDIACGGFVEIRTDAGMIVAIWNATKTLRGTIAARFTFASICFLDHFTDAIVAALFVHATFAQYRACGSSFQ